MESFFKIKKLAIGSVVLVESYDSQISSKTEDIYLSRYTN